jgi:hypothetical protein
MKWNASQNIQKYLLHTQKCTRQNIFQIFGLNHCTQVCIFSSIPHFPDFIPPPFPSFPNLCFSLTCFLHLFHLIFSYFRTSFYIRVFPHLFPSSSKIVLHFHLHSFLNFPTHILLLSLLFPHLMPSLLLESFTLLIYSFRLLLSVCPTFIFVFLLFYSFLPLAPFFFLPDTSSFLIPSCHFVLSYSSLSLNPYIPSCHFILSYSFLPLHPFFFLPATSFFIIPPRHFILSYSPCHFILAQSTVPFHHPICLISASCFPFLFPLSNFFLSLLSSLAYSLFFYPRPLALLLPCLSLPDPSFILPSPSSLFLPCSFFSLSCPLLFRPPGSPPSSSIPQPLH